MNDELRELGVGEILRRMEHIAAKMDRIKKQYKQATEDDCAPLIQDRKALTDELIRRGSIGETL